MRGRPTSRSLLGEQVPRRKQVRWSIDVRILDWIEEQMRAHPRKDRPSAALMAEEVMRQGIENLESRLRDGADSPARQEITYTEAMEHGLRIGSQRLKEETTDYAPRPDIEKVRLMARRLFGKPPEGDPN